MIKQKAQYVRCLNNQPYVGYTNQPLPTKPLVGLVVGQVYKVAPPEENDGDLWRVIDETGGDYLYPARYFEPLDLTEADAKILADHLALQGMSDTEYLLSMAGLFSSESSATSEHVSAIVAEYLLKKYEQSEI